PGRGLFCANLHDPMFNEHLALGEHDATAPLDPGRQFISLKQNRFRVAGYVVGQAQQVVRKDAGWGEDQTSERQDGANQPSSLVALAPHDASRETKMNVRRRIIERLEGVSSAGRTPAK